MEDMIEGNLPFQKRTTEATFVEGSSGTEFVHRTIELTREQQMKLQAGMALILSSPLNYESDKGSSRLSELLGKVLATTDLQSLPQAPHRKDALLTEFTIVRLGECGWELHGTFEPTISILVKNEAKIQFERGGTPVSSRPLAGTHFDSANNDYAREVWETNYAVTEVELRRGYQQIRQIEVDIVPDLAQILTRDDWGQITATEITSFCEQHPRAALAFVREFSPHFVDRLLTN